jgi:hypothetical protein
MLASGAGGRTHLTSESEPRGPSLRGNEGLVVFPEGLEVRTLVLWEGLVPGMSGSSPTAKGSTSSNTSP